MAAALSLADEDGYLHAHEACQIVVAAAIVGAARGEESELKDQWRESGGIAGWSADLDAITVALR